MVPDNIFSRNSKLSPREQALFDVLEEVANAGSVCPSNRELCDLLDYSSASTPPTVMNKLMAKGYIGVERFGGSRIVTIFSTGRRTAGERGKRHFRASQPDDKDFQQPYLTLGEAKTLRDEIESFLAKTDSPKTWLGRCAVGYSNGVQQLLSAETPLVSTAEKYRKAMAENPDGEPRQRRHGGDPDQIERAENIRMAKEEIDRRRDEAAAIKRERFQKCHAAHVKKYGASAPFGRPVDRMPA